MAREFSFAVKSFNLRREPKSLNICSRLPSKSIDRAEIARVAKIPQIKKPEKKYFNGLKFGLLLQIAVGPMCLMVFNTAKNVGLLVAMSLVIAIALVDAFYILLASLGASKLLGNEKVEKVVKIVGAIVLMIFGLNIILNVFGINIIPGLNLNPNSSSAFIQGIILTLSNPITIVFWGSVLTTKIIESNIG